MPTSPPTPATESDVAACLDARRRRCMSRWGLSNEIVVIGAGEPVPMPGRGDQLHPFRPHPEYFYLTDCQEPGAVLAFDPAEGWVHFVPKLTAAEAMWRAAPNSAGPSRAELASWLERRRERPVACLGCPVPEVAAADVPLGQRLTKDLDEIRRPKDPIELARMRRAAAATAFGFAQLPDLLVAGQTERAVQIEMEAAFFRQGADHLAYETIVAGGPNSATLHFLPTSRPFRDGDLVLIDAGAEYLGYAADVTRTYPLSGRFSPEQAEIYSIVLAAERAAIGRCLAGTEFRDVHLQASVEIAAGLVEFGLLRGDAQSLVEQGAHALFFPHGIGHMVGLGVRDVGGYLPDPKPDEPPALRYLRTDLPLRPGYVMTIEPGIYFIQALLNAPDERERNRDLVNWDLAARMMEFGGVRIEDNVHVTDAAGEVLSAGIPILPGP